MCHQQLWHLGEIAAIMPNMMLVSLSRLAVNFLPAGTSYALFERKLPGILKCWAGSINWRTSRVREGV